MSRTRTLCAIALGSNQGNRRAHLELALRRLTETFGSIVQSSIFETEPEGVTVAQPPFLNMVVLARTTLDAPQTLERLLAIEREAGRERPFPAAPRTLDLDLVLFGDLVLMGPELTVPHPRFRGRMFVLEPLAEIAPELTDPVSGLTMASLLERLRSRRS
ncbi:MAG: 2-amino-4-hydroxy-6-hydroxymethyldihydropteridine diphosphokinase [Vicinamibacterales bacterium]